MSNCTFPEPDSIAPTLQAYRQARANSSTVTERVVRALDVFDQYFKRFVREIFFLRFPRAWWTSDNTGIPHSYDTMETTSCNSFSLVWPSYSQPLFLPTTLMILCWPSSGVQVHTISSYSSSICIPWRTLNERADRLRTPTPTLIKSRAYKPCEGRQSGSACWELVSWSIAAQLGSLKWNLRLIPLLTIFVR